MEGPSYNAHILPFERECCGQHQRLPTTAPFLLASKAPMLSHSPQYPRASGKAASLTQSQVEANHGSHLSPCKSLVLVWASDPVWPKGTRKFCRGLLAEVFSALLFSCLWPSLFMRTQVRAAAATTGPWGDKLEDRCQTLKLPKREEEMHLGILLINVQSALALDFWFT